MTTTKKIATCRIDTGNGRVTVAAEATETPGLFITPDTQGDSFTSFFSLTHGPSGRRIPTSWNGDDLDHIRAVAKALGETPVDWTGELEAVAAQITEHGEAVQKARKDAKYPIVVAEDVETLGAYPKSEEQATSDAIAKHLTRALQYRTRETWNLTGRDDADGLRIHAEHAAALVSEWALIYALREFAKVDQQVADSIARDIWNAWEDGSTVHEIAWDWAREYGLPVLPDKDEDAETPAVTTITPIEVL